MAKSHELKIEKSIFENFTKTNYLIVKNDNYEKLDFILLQEFENIEVEEETIQRDTERYQMTQISEIITSEGLKSGYVLLVLRSL